MEILDPRERPEKPTPGLVVATYDAVAAEYDAKAAERKAVSKVLIDRLAQFIPEGGSVLDVGCAVGVQVECLLEAGYDVTGVDISPQMVEFAQRRNPQARILVGDVFSLPEGDAYDGILALAFIHLFPKTAVAEIMAKLKTFLAEDGVLHLTTTLAQQSREGWEEKQDYQGGHGRFRKHWTHEELVAFLRKNDWRILDDYLLRDSFEKEWMNITITAS